MNHSEFIERIRPLIEKYPEQSLEVYSEYILGFMKIIDSLTPTPLSVGFTENPEYISKLIHFHQKNLLSLCLPLIETLIKNGSLAFIEMLLEKEIISSEAALKTREIVKNDFSLSSETTTTH